MIEILTPTQYEPALDVLNQINRLSISDKASLSIDAMQACKNPVGTGQPIIGKFVKEDNHGAIVGHEVIKELTNFEYYDMNMVSPPMYRSYTFAQKVYGVMVLSWNRYPATEYNYWATPEWGIIKILPFWVHDWLPFEGETIFISTNHITIRGRVHIWGFY